MTKSPNSARCMRLVLLAMALGMLPAWAQWQWTDTHGRQVFSDTAPPAHIPDSAIQRRPSGQQKPPATLPEQPSNNPTAEKKSAELAAKKKQAEEAEKTKQKDGEQKAAQARAENCQRAQRGLASLNTESRVTTVNAKGERVIIDETLRNAEKARLQQIMLQSCRP